MNAQLVKIDAAALATGKSVRQLFDLADGGSLLEPGYLWVWNLANYLEGERRDLRFWYPELQMRETAAKWSLDQVVEKILPPTRTNFHAGEVDAMFQIRHRTRLDFTELNGGLVNGRTLYPRETLVAFLHRRWLGANKFHPASAEERDNGRGTNERRTVSESPIKALSRSLEKVAVAG